MARNTSVAAYNNLVTSGALSEIHSRAYMVVFKHGPLTANQAAERLDATSSNNVRSRFSELREMGVLVELGTVECPISHRRVIQWDVTNRVEPLERRKADKKPSYKVLEAINSKLQNEIQDYEAFLSTLT